MQEQFEVTNYNQKDNKHQVQKIFTTEQVSNQNKCNPTLIFSHSKQERTSNQMQPIFKVEKVQDGINNNYSSTDFLNYQNDVTSQNIDRYNEYHLKYNQSIQGRWTFKEHKKFLEAVRMFGKDWNKVHAYIGTRTSAQTRSHAQKYFHKLCKKRTSEEEDLYQVLVLNARKKGGQLEMTDSMDSQNNTQNNNSPHIKTKSINKIFSHKKMKSGMSRRQSHNETLNGKFKTTLKRKFSTTKIQFKCIQNPKHHNSSSNQQHQLELLSNANGQFPQKQKIFEVQKCFQQNKQGIIKEQFNEAPTQAQSIQQQNGISDIGQVEDEEQDNYSELQKQFKQLQKYQQEKANQNNHLLESYPNSQFNAQQNFNMNMNLNMINQQRQALGFYNPLQNHQNQYNQLLDQQNQLNRLNESDLNKPINLPSEISGLAGDLSREELQTHSFKRARAFYSLPQQFNNMQHHMFENMFLNLDQNNGTNNQCQNYNNVRVDRNKPIELTSNRNEQNMPLQYFFRPTLMYPPSTLNYLQSQLIRQEMQTDPTLNQQQNLSAQPHSFNGHIPDNYQMQNDQQDNTNFFDLQPLSNRTSFKGSFKGSFKSTFGRFTRNPNMDQ